MSFVLPNRRSASLGFQFASTIGFLERVRQCRSLGCILLLILGSIGHPTSGLAQQVETIPATIGWQAKTPPCNPNGFFPSVADAYACDLAYYATFNPSFNDWQLTGVITFPNPDDACFQTHSNNANLIYDCGEQSTAAASCPAGYSMPATQWQTSAMCHITVYANDQTQKKCDFLPGQFCFPRVRQQSADRNRLRGTGSHPSGLSTNLQQQPAIRNGLAYEPGSLTQLPKHVGPRNLSSRGRKLFFLAPSMGAGRGCQLPDGWQR